MSSLHTSSICVYLYIIYVCIFIHHLCVYIYTLSMCVYLYIIHVCIFIHNNIELTSSQEHVAKILRIFRFSILSSNFCLQWIMLRKIHIKDIILTTRGLVVEQVRQIRMKKCNSERLVIEKQNTHKTNQNKIRYKCYESRLDVNLMTTFVSLKVEVITWINEQAVWCDWIRPI